MTLISESSIEAARLNALARSSLLDSQPEERFDRITRLVTHSLNVPVALISLVDEDRQFFKSTVGLPEPWASCRETPLSHSFCKHVVVERAKLRVADARSHPVVAQNLAVQDLSVVAYLGVPLHGPTGHVLGSLCAIDSKPRDWSDHDERTLYDLAAIVEDQIGLTFTEKRWREILSTMPQMVWSTRPDGFHDYYNDRWYEFTGVPYGSTDGEGWNDMFHPEDQQKAWTQWRHSLATGEPYEIEYRLRHKSGQYRWTLGRALPIRDNTGAIERWFGTCTDIHDLKSAETQRDLIARELAHRIQNIFAVVSSLVNMSARGVPAAREFADAVGGRILALAKAHKYVKSDGANSVHATFDHDHTVHGLIATVLAPYREPNNPKRIIVDGCDAPIDMRTATALALALHELATNSVKYGALSAEAGELAISCHAASEILTITWRERGGPIVEEAPTRSGFGSELVVSAAVTQLGAKLERQWEREGLTVTIDIPVANLDQSATNTFRG